jgi:hypothetical protein
MAVTWDCSVLPFQSVEFTRRNMSRSGGLTLSGIEQVVQSSSDFWAANVTVKIRKWEQILAYRALQAQSYGRATEWIIPVPISAGIYAQTRFVIQNYPEASFSSEFSAEFMEDDIRTTILTVPYPHITGKVNATALRGATSLTFTMDNSAWVPVPGTYFSIGSRLYLMATVSGPVGAGAGGGGGGSGGGTTGATASGVYTATFVPKVRATANVGSPIEFSQPKCLMRLAQDNIGQMNLDMLKFADVSLSFVEVPA